MPDASTASKLKTEGILITVSGLDRAGITAELMEIITQSSYEILDMGQSVTHGLLSLSILISQQGQQQQKAPPILKDLLFAAKKMDVSLDFKLMDISSMQTAVEDKFILSCVGKKTITARFLCDISQMLANSKINILRIDNVNAGQNFKSVEMTTAIPHAIDLKEIKSSLLQIGQTHHTDMALLKANVYRRSKRLIAFDMDSTLIQAEVIDEMAQVCGVGKEVAAITQQAMEGKLNFTDALTRRVALLRGLASKKLPAILADLPLTPGTREFITTVKNLGYKVAIISGGFEYFAQALKEQLGLDYAFANRLEIAEGALTGKLVGPVIDGEGKARLLEQIAHKEHISLDQVVAIGDGANDLAMLAKAGLGVAFYAKEAVKKHADNHLSFGTMTTILYFLGIPERDQSN